MFGSWLFEAEKKENGAFAEQMASGGLASHQTLSLWVHDCRAGERSRQIATRVQMPHTLSSGLNIRFRGAPEAMSKRFWA